MSEITRSGGMGRRAPVFVVLFGSLVVCLGQETATQTPAAAPAASQDVAKPDPPKEAATPPVTPVEDPPTPAAQAPAPAPAVPAQPPAATPAPTQPAAKGKKPPKKDSTPSGNGEVTAKGVQTKPYEIGPEDVLFLNVLHQADVSGTLEVRPDGYVSVRFAGEIRAAGLTTSQLGDAIADKLKTYFNNPEVNIQVMRINSKKYYISGEVRKAGAFPLTSPKTIYEALIEAGGLADFAKKTKIYILRGEQRIPFNYKDVSRGKNLRQNIHLENGDVIVVP